jgi:hypothetical protein
VNLYEVKSPVESKYAWDYYKLLATTPAAEGFRPLDAGGARRFIPAARVLGRTRRGWHKVRSPLPPIAISG